MQFQLLFINSEFSWDDWLVTWPPDCLLFVRCRRTYGTLCTLPTYGSSHATGCQTQLDIPLTFPSKWVLFTYKLSVKYKVCCATQFLRREYTQLYTCSVLHYNFSCLLTPVTSHFPKSGTPYFSCMSHVILGPVFPANHFTVVRTNQAYNTQDKHKKPKQLIKNQTRKWTGSITTRRMAIANGMCDSFCNQPKAYFRPPSTPLGQSW